MSYAITSPTTGYKVTSTDVYHTTKRQWRYVWQGMRCVAIKRQIELFFWRKDHPNKNPTLSMETPDN